MPHERLTVATTDGAMPLHVLTARDSAGGANDPGGPAVVFYMDAGGIRPAALAMAQRLADAGYVVAVPDLFYRHGPYGPLVPAEVFAGDVAATLGPLMATTGNAVAAKDTAAVLAHLDARADVRGGGGVGAVGFCMGGPMAIVAAGTYPDRFKAVASFHGSGLATDAPDSPHRYAGKLEAELYVAAATDDPHCPPDMLEAFERAMDGASVTYRSETYPAAHGWMKPDFPVHHPEQAERGWHAMTTFFDRTLKTG
jgi:carboxymethylenebutenolidase